jgi:ABC-type sugar transport system substrate-binding protein
MSQRLESTVVRIRMVLIGSIMGVVWSGCGTGDFVPPPPPGLRETGGGASGSKAGPSAAARDPFVTGTTVRNIEFIPARGIDPDDAAAERSTARSQAGFEKARLHILPDDDTGSPESGPGLKHEATHRGKSQAELVRGAISRKAQALIVEPDDPASEELARAIQEVRAAKIPVIVLGGASTEVEKASAPAPMVVVRPESFATSARQLVTLSIRNARTAKLDPEGGAILLVRETSDRLMLDRVAAVREALKSAKITAVEELRVPKVLDAGKDALRKRLLADPKPAMVFFFDHTGATASNNLAGEIVEQRPFIQAGYTSDNSLPRMAQAGEFAAVAEYLPNRLIQRAISAAVAVAQGRSVKEKEEIPIPVIESPPTSGVPRLQLNQNKARMERVKGGD